MELEAAQPGFWDDTRQAQRKMQTLGRVKDTVTLWRELRTQAENLKELTDLALEEGDESIQEELEGKRARFPPSWPAKRSI